MRCGASKKALIRRKFERETVQGLLEGGACLRPNTCYRKYSKRPANPTLWNTFPTISFSKEFYQSCSFIYYLWYEIPDYRKCILVKQTIKQAIKLLICHEVKETIKGLKISFKQTKNLSTAQLCGSLLTSVLPNVILFTTNFVSFNWRNHLFMVQSCKMKNWSKRFT